MFFVEYPKLIMSISCVGPCTESARREFARKRSVDNSLMNRSAIVGYMTHRVLDTAKSRAEYYV